MKEEYIRLIESNGRKFAEVMTDEVVINNVDEALDVLAFAGENGTNLLLFHERNFHPDFYNLKTGLAGEILQKFSNYQIRAAICGQFGRVGSKRFSEFIYECNRGRQLHFSDDRNKSVAWLLGEV